MTMMIPRVLKRSKPYRSKVDTNLLHLPRDILVDILLRLDLKSIRSFQRASKMLNNIVDKDFVAQWRLHNAISTGHQKPHLMILARSHDGNNKITKTFHPLEYDDIASNMVERSSEIIVSQKCNYQVHCVFSNLICFKDVRYGGQSFLLDPLKRQVLELPAREVPTSTRCRRGLFEWLAMGFDDTTGTLKILRVGGNSQYKNLVAQVLVLGTSSWREIPAVPPCNLSHKNASACGDMHWVISTKTRIRGKGESNILSFDFKKEEFYWTPHPTLRTDGSRTSDLNLVNLRGCLAIVDAYLGYHGFIEIHVLENFKEKNWVLKYCIQTTFEIDVEPIMSSCGEWEHGIYFKDEISTGAQNRANAMFLDLRGGTDNVQVELFKCPMLNWTIISYTESLISLKHYGNLVEKEASESTQKKLGFSEKSWKIIAKI